MRLAILTAVLLAVAVIVFLLMRRGTAGSKRSGPARAPVVAPELKDSGEDIDQVKRRLDWEIQKNMAQSELADRLSTARRAARQAQRQNSENLDDSGEGSPEGPDEHHSGSSSTNPR